MDLGIVSQLEVIERLVELIKKSSNLDVIDLRGMYLSESATATLLIAMSQSQSIRNLKHLPKLDKEVCSTNRVVAVLPELI